MTFHLNRFITKVSAATLSASALLLALSACSANTNSPTQSSRSSTCTGVTVVVNFGLLSAGDIVACAPLESGTESVADALASVNVSTEGTVKYGDQVVCRVNGLPSASKPFTVPGHKPYSETCATMGPAYAYWALWVKTPHNAKHSGWDYAQAGVATQQVAPGDFIGLVFSTGGKTPKPSE